MGLGFTGEVNVHGFEVSRFFNFVVRVEDFCGLDSGFMDGDFDLHRVFSQVCHFLFYWWVVHWTLDCKVSLHGLAILKESLQVSGDLEFGDLLLFS